MYASVEPILCPTLTDTENCLERVAGCIDNVVM